MKRSKRSNKNCKSAKQTGMLARFARVSVIIIINSDLPITCNKMDKFESRIILSASRQ